MGVDEDRAEFIRDYVFYFGETDINDPEFRVKLIKKFPDMIGGSQEHTSIGGSNVLGIMVNIRKLNRAIRHGVRLGMIESKKGVVRYAGE